MASSASAFQLHQFLVVTAKRVRIRKTSCCIKYASRHYEKQPQNPPYVANLELSRLLALFTLVIRRLHINIVAAKTEFSRKIVASLYSLMCSQESHASQSKQ